MKVNNRMTAKEFILLLVSKVVLVGMDTQHSTLKEAISWR
jgi:hypothetical protein